jgi:hypothetical protein
MIPIYRQHDGGDTKDLNKETFKKATAVLSFGRNLLIFGEGFTDDVFIRRLKPVKKGAARMGFTALESINWKKKIYIAAVGNNYTEPNTMRSELLISTSKKICLNDYKAAYLENPNKVINEVTKLIEQLMQDQITHIENIEYCDFHEQIMCITRKGMNNQSHDEKIPLIKRWNYSKKLAHWFNEKDKLDHDLLELKEKSDQYFKLLKKLKVKDSLIYEKAHGGQAKRTGELTKLILLFPFLIPGLFHCGLIYLVVKRFVEKSFKRKVFWGSTKLVMAMFAMSILNLPFIFLFHAFVYPSWILGIAYFCAIGLFGLATYEWFLALRSFKEKGIVNKTNTSGLESRRLELEKEIGRLIPEF